MIIPNRNLLAEQAPKTFLASAIAAGATVYPVKNTSGFTTSYAIQVGETGNERSEVLIGTVTNAGTITGAAALYPHPADTPVYNIKFNQVVFSKSTSGTTGSPTPITDGTITYQADALTTNFDDLTGTTTDAYRVQLRNSVLDILSAYSDWVTFSGFPFYSLAKMRERVKEKMWNPNFLSDGVIDNWINEWKDEMVNAAISVNENYAMGTVEIGFGTNGLGTITIPDFKQPRRVWVTYDGGNNYSNSTKSEPNSFLPNQVLSATRPYHTFHGDNVMEFKPSAQGGAALIEFYRFGTTMVNDTDELPLPLRPYTKSFVDYALSQAFLKDGRTGDYLNALREAQAAKEVFKLESSPRDKSSQTQVELVEATGVEGWYL